MSTASEPFAPRPRVAPPRLNLLPEPPPPPKRTAWRRLPWLLGLIVLAVTLLGASKMLHSGSGEDKRESEASSALTADFGGAPAVVCHGIVAVENNLGQLAPLQPGQIAEIPVTEGQSVKANDPILKLDEEPARIAVGEAEAGVKAAEAKWAQAKQGIEQLRHALEAQQAAIDAAQAKLAGAEAQLRRLEGLREKNLSNENDLNAARHAVQALREAVKGEQAKYRQIQAQQPEDKVREAEAGLKLAQEQLRAEKFKLEKCTLRAPSDGTILRINVSKGMVITAQTRLEPVLFCPAGPRIVRGEIPPEFASRVHPGMEAVVRDEADPAMRWTGRVKRLADAFLPKRSQGNEVISLGGEENRVLECTVELAPSANPPRLGQKVRIAIGEK